MNGEVVECSGKVRRSPRSAASAERTSVGTAARTRRADLGCWRPGITHDGTFELIDLAGGEGKSPPPGDVSHHRRQTAEDPLDPFLARMKPVQDARPPFRPFGDVAP